MKLFIHTIGQKAKDASRNKIKGHHSSNIKGLLGYITKSEVVHKNDMVEI